VAGTPRQGRPSTGLALALATLATGAVLAGCVGPEPSPAEPPRLPSPFLRLDLGPGAWAFDHRGGNLTLDVSGSGAPVPLDAWGPGGQRLGHWSPSPGGRIDLPAAAGTYIVAVGATDGWVRARSDGQPDLAWPLPQDHRRIVLAETAPGLQPPLPAPFGPGTQTFPIDVDLGRAPTSLALLAEGGFNSLRITLRSGNETVLHADLAGGPAVPFFDGLTDVQATSAPEKARDGHLDGTLVVDGLQGAIVLEAGVLSLAAPAGQDRVSPAAWPPPFTYGKLPAVPVAFQVASAATEVRLASAATDGDAWVALFGPGDERLATVQVAPHQPVAVELPGAGTYVAAVLEGNLTLGADAAPADFSLVPLSVSTIDLPESTASPDGYGQSNATLTPDAATGVVFDARPAQADMVGAVPAFGLACGDESLRLLRGGPDGEAVAAWGPGWADPTLRAGALLANGPMTVWSDSTGNPSGCPHEVVRFVAYHRS